MNYRDHTLLFIMLVLVTVIPADIVLGDDLNNLINIQQKFAASIKPQFEAYYQELSALEQSLVEQNITAGLTEVRNEIKKVSGQLKGITTLINYQPAPEPLPAVKPVPVAQPEPLVNSKPVAELKPKTHIRDTKGIAGSTKFSKNNIYSFHLPTTGKNSSLTFYATGRRSTDTKGQVWLIKPGGERLKIAKWKEKDFKYSAKEIKTYKKLQPIKADLSDQINTPGLYKVEFEWTGGIDPLVIYRVELTS